MQIKIQQDSQQIAAADHLEMNQRARHWLKRLQALIRGIYVRITDASASAGAQDRFCLIEAHMENGIRLQAQARGRAAIIAIDRALRRLVRAIQSQLKREAAIRELRLLTSS